jgi:hypothetical protein
MVQQSSLWSRVFDRNAEWKKADLFLVLHWMRQILGVVLGLLMGFLHVTGYLGNLTFFAVTALSTWAYYAKFLQVDEEEFGGSWELISEGMGPAFGSFLLSWICTYTILYN